MSQTEHPRSRLLDGAKCYDAMRTRFVKFLELISKINLPELTFDSGPKQKDRVAFEFAGSNHLIRHRFSGGPKFESIIELIRVDDTDRDKYQPIRHVYLNAQGKYRIEMTDAHPWQDGLPGESEDLFYTLLAGW